MVWNWQIANKGNTEIKNDHNTKDHTALYCWDTEPDDLGKECKEEEEINKHLICFYPALTNRRRKTLCQVTLEELEQTAELDVNDLKNVITLCHAINN